MNLIMSINLNTYFSNQEIDKKIINKNYDITRIRISDNYSNIFSRLFIPINFFKQK